MKKISILGLCLLAVGSMSAQKQLVKDVEHDLKAKPDSYPESIKKLTPAFTNAETATDAQTWFVAGTGAYGFFDDQLMKLRIGQTIDKKAVGTALIDGYGYFMNTLANDTVVDAKGKIKTKYSKKAIDAIKNHYVNYQDAAALLYESEDYNGAVKAWEIFVNAGENPVLVKNGLKVAADTIIADMYFNLGIGNSLIQNNEAALNSFKSAIAKGYTKKAAYDYAIAAASAMQNPEEMAAIAREAYPLFGKEDSRYIGYMINNLIDKKKYDEAVTLVDQYITADPENSQLYLFKGAVNESKEDYEAAISNYEKAAQLDPQNARACLYLGNQLYMKALRIDEAEGGGLSTAEYNKLRDEKVNPLLRQAAQNIEKSYELDDTISEARGLLKSIYYILNDEENLKRVETM